MERKIKQIIIVALEKWLVRLFRRLEFSFMAKEKCFNRPYLLIFRDIFSYLFTLLKKLSKWFSNCCINTWLFFSHFFDYFPF